MKSMILFFLLTFLFQAALTRGDLLFHIGKIIFTKQGAYLGILTIGRFSAIYLCSTILTMTTSPMKLASGLESLFSPLSKLHVPINQLSMIITISLRFIPTIIEETENIKCAQRSRGAQFQSKNLITRLKTMSSVLIPVLATSLQRANELAAAMESRGYDHQSSSITTAELHYKKKDIVFGGLLLINLVACFVI
jgi:energy-coupling factor transport system permease protein